VDVLERVRCALPEAGMKLRKETKRIIVHHSGSPRTTRLAEIRRWHVQDRGFDEIGYHFVIEGDGLTLRARDIHYIGAHAAGANEDSIGVSVVGDNTRLEHAWSHGQILSLRQLVATLQDVFGPLVVYGHKDAKGGTTATACPGLDVQTVL